MKCNQCGTEFEGKFCYNCGAPAPIEVQASETPSEQVYTYTQTPTIPVNQSANQKKAKKPLIKKWWFWVIVVIVVLSILSGIGGSNSDDNNNAVPGISDNVSGENEPSKSNNSNKDNNTKVTVIDFSDMSKSDIQAWADENNVVCKFSEDYSDTVENGKVISQNKKAGDTVKEGATITVVISMGKKPSLEYLNALSKAKTYSDLMFMSKQGIYDQLTSPYGEKFPADAAQYAIDHLDADYNKNALEKAKVYQQSMGMSKSAIYDQLVSEYGEKFTAEEAQYAIDHLE